MHGAYNVKHYFPYAMKLSHWLMKTVSTPATPKETYDFVCCNRDIIPT